MADGKRVRGGATPGVSSTSGIASIGLTLAAVMGCSTGPIENQRPNHAPETLLVSGPPDSTTATSYRVHFAWSGTDPDRGGAVDHFEFILVDHPPPGSSGAEGRRTTSITVPGVDDPRWRATTAMESTFVTSADSLPRDPRPGPDENPEEVRRINFERWHTFFIRAIDDRGLPDPTPDYRSFNARTLAPTVAFLPPVVPGYEFRPPIRVTPRWTGEDPIDEFASQPPDSSRWVLIPSEYGYGFPRSGYVSFPDSLYDLPTRFHWSAWKPWNASDGSGVQVQLSDWAPYKHYILAVQAKDEAGAITPVFDWETPGKNNVALIDPVGYADRVTPMLQVDESHLGTVTFARDSRTIEIQAPAGLPLHFRWHGDPLAYGTSIEAYRSGWDQRDPGDDASWEQPWSPTALETRRAFDSGVHWLRIEARDDLGLVVSAAIVIEIVPFTPVRPLLLVDDADYTYAPGEERESDTRWRDALTTIAAEAGFAFDPGLDIFDVYENRGYPPPTSLLFSYGAVVWSNRSGPTRTSALRDVARYSDPFEYTSNPRNFNVVKAYLSAGGKLWIHGFRPARQLWPVERVRPDQWLSPVPVTNWDDGYNPHPGVDSMGTTSIHYMMGIETFESGAGTDTPRSVLQLFCQGFAPAAADAPSLVVDRQRWAQPANQTGLHGRSNIEIYNMPAVLRAQDPPLAPPPDRVLVAYTYVSGEDRGAGLTYPRTANGQPAFLLAKARPGDAHYSCAFCGFEPHLLEFDSQVALCRYVLVDKMGITATPAPKLRP
jgi:hypothetical protein